MNAPPSANPPEGERLTDPSRLVKQGEAYLECELKEWEGGVIVYRYPSAELMMDWYYSLPTKEESQEDERMQEFISFEQRSRFVKRWMIKGLKAEHVEGDGSKCPDMRILAWLNYEIGKIIQEARDPFDRLGKLRRQEALLKAAKLD